MFCGNIKDDTIITNAYIPDSYYDDVKKITLTKADVILSNQSNVG